MKRYFITGTDTDSGKTYVTCQLLNYFKERQKKVGAIKPIASGCIQQGESLISQDAELLNEYNMDLQQDICPWKFKSPISPHLAAEQDGKRVSVQSIVDYCFNDSFSHLEYQLIEGAGGLMVPLNWKETWLDFLTMSQIPVILVVGMRLGCINHALLTELALHTHQITCNGWIANCLDKNMLALTENIQTLSEKMQLPLLARVPYQGKIINDGLNFL